MDHIICQNCSKKINNSTFCPYCGAINEIFQNIKQKPTISQISPLGSSSNQLLQEENNSIKIGRNAQNSME